jgi:hypothetical protein
MTEYLLKKPGKVGQGDFNLHFLVAASFINETQNTGEFSKKAIFL